MRLTAEMEADLLKRRDDPKVENYLVKCFTPLVNKCVSKYKRSPWLIDDLRQEGLIGLVQAIRKFDPSFNARLSTYATYYIKERIHSYAFLQSNVVKPPQTPREKRLFLSLSAEHREYSTAGNYFTAKQVDVLCTKYEVSRNEFERIHSLWKGSYSLNAPVHDDFDNMSWEDILTSDDLPADQAIIQSEANDAILSHIRSALQSLSPMSASIFHDRFLSDDPPSRESVARKHKTNPNRVAKAERDGARAIQREMRAA